MTNDGKGGMDMVEHVARAICFANDPKGISQAWKYRTEENREAMRIEARAAIAAMRDCEFRVCDDGGSPISQLPLALVERCRRHLGLALDEPCPPQSYRESVEALLRGLASEGWTISAPFVPLGPAEAGYVQKLYLMW